MMANLTRWEPMGELRRIQNLMDRMMGDTLMGRSWFSDTSDGLLPLDVYETDESIVIDASLPGMTDENIDISITGDTLSIRAEQDEEHEEHPENGAKYYLRERRFHRLSRTLRLPSEVDADKAQAEFDNGVLHLTIPKVEAVKPKTINIQAK